MKRIRGEFSILWLVVLLVGLLAVGCGGGGGTPPAETYTISGRVVEDGDPDQGIEGVAILVRRGTTELGTTDTGADGRWTYTNVTGTVTVTPSKDGYTFDPPSIPNISGARTNVDFRGIPDVGAPQAFIVVRRLDLGQGLFEVEVHEVTNSEAIRFRILDSGEEDTKLIGDPANVADEADEWDYISFADRFGGVVDGQITIELYDDRDVLHVIRGIDAPIDGEWVDLEDPPASGGSVVSTAARQVTPLAMPYSSLDRLRTVEMLADEPGVIASALVPLAGDQERRVYFGEVGDREVDVAAVDGFILVHDVMLDIGYAFANPDDLNRVILEKLSVTRNFRNMYLYYRLPGRAQIVDGWPVDDRASTFTQGDGSSEAARFNEALSQLRAVFTEDAPYSPEAEDVAGLEWADIELMERHELGQWMVDVSVVEVSPGLQHATGFTIAGLTHTGDEADWAPHSGEIGGVPIGHSVMLDEIGLLILGDRVSTGGSVSGVVTLEDDPFPEAQVMLIEWPEQHFHFLDDPRYLWGGSESPMVGALDDLGEVIPPDLETPADFWGWIEEIFADFPYRIQYSDTAGLYQFDNVVPGRYALLAFGTVDIEPGTDFTPVFSMPQQLQVLVDRHHVRAISLMRQAMGWVDTTISGRVRNAVTNENVSGATVSVWYNDQEVYSMATGTDGTFRVTVPALVGDHIDLWITQDGYSDFTRDFQVTGDDYTESVFLSPHLVEDETGVVQGNRYVLSWGQNPRDLDSHLLVPQSDTDGSRGFHLYYVTRGSATEGNYPYATLDRDVTTGFGPETVTIHRRFNQPYTYYVYKFSGTGNIAGSGAKVDIYTRDGLAHTVREPGAQHGAGRFWHVFDLDADGTVRIVNEIRDTAPTIGVGTRSAVAAQEAVFMPPKD